MKTKILGVLFVMTILLAACAPQTAPTTAPAAPAATAPAGSGVEVKVNISNFAFDPPSVTIKVGDTVTWTNQDGTAHTVVADDGSWKSDSLAQGASFSHTFTTAGTFTYKCSIHPNMMGTVIVQ